jgi:hypothetical protein
MTLAEIKHEIDELSPEEIELLYVYLEERRELSPETRIRMIEEAVAGIREGMTQQELDEMFAAMNEERVKLVDESIWQE